MVPTPQDLVIGELLSLATNDDIKEVLNLLQADKDESTNAKAIFPFLKDRLIEVAEFLKTLNKQSHLTEKLKSSKAKNKMPISQDIVSYIFSLFPANCQVCSATYTHEDTAELKCYACNRGCHPGCYSVEHVDESKGIFFFCAVCTPSIKKMKDHGIGSTTVTTNESVASQTNVTIGPKELEGEVLTTKEAQVVAEGTANNAVEEVDKEEKKEEKKELKKRVPHPKPSPQKDICPLLLKGVCPFGLTGSGCKGYHPIRCRDYAAFGTHRKYGCNRKHKCKYFHPKLCITALRTKKCDDTECRDVHIRGTQRWKVWQPNQAEDKSGHRAKKPPAQKKPPPTPPVEERKKPKTDDQPAASPGDQNHFLLILEQMRADLAVQKAQQAQQQANLSQLVTNQITETMKALMMQQQMPQQIPSSLEQGLIGSTQLYPQYPQCRFPMSSSQGQSQAGQIFYTPMQGS